MFRPTIVYFDTSIPDVPAWDALIMAPTSTSVPAISAAQTGEDLITYTIQTKFFSITSGGVQDLEPGESFWMFKTVSDIVVTKVEGYVVGGPIKMDLRQNEKYDGSGTGNAEGDVSLDVTGSAFGDNEKELNIVIPAGRIVYMQLEEFPEGMPISKFFYQIEYHYLNVIE